MKNEFTNSPEQLEIIAKALGYKAVYSELNELCSFDGGIKVRNENGIMFSFSPKKDANQLLEIIKRFKVDIYWPDNRLCEATIYKKITISDVTSSFVACGNKVEDKLEDAVLAAVWESLSD